MSRPAGDNSARPGRSPERGSRRRAILFGLVALASIGVAGYAIVGYTTRPLGSLVHPDMRVTFNAHRLAIYTHIFASSLALLLGPPQFLPAIRRRWPVAHRWMGRAYLGVGVLMGGLAGLYMAWHAYGGPVSTAGFGLLALAWLFTGLRAYERARARDFTAHRAWMIRNFCLTLAAVTFRIGLGLGFASGLPFEVFYPPLTWACWVPNLIVGEAVVRWSGAPAATHAGPMARQA